jgi:hypothetical protein
MFFKKEKTIAEMGDGERLAFYRAIQELGFSNTPSYVATKWSTYESIRRALEKLERQRIKDNEGQR